MGEKQVKVDSVTDGLHEKVSGCSQDILEQLHWYVLAPVLFNILINGLAQKLGVC